MNKREIMRMLEDEEQFRARVFQEVDPSAKNAFKSVLFLSAIGIGVFAYFFWTFEILPLIVRICVIAVMVGYVLYHGYNLKRNFKKLSEEIKKKNESLLAGFKAKPCVRIFHYLDLEDFAVIVIAHNEREQETFEFIIKKLFIENKKMKSKAKKLLKQEISLDKYYKYYKKCIMEQGIDPNTITVAVRPLVKKPFKELYDTAAFLIVENEPFEIANHLQVGSVAPFYPIANERLDS